jgi:hypothetical protein
MGDARVVTAADIISSINYELRNTRGKQYSDAELLAYLNKCLELVHEILIDCNSELAGVNTESIVLYPGVEQYSLGANDMGDMLTIRRVDPDDYYAVYLEDTDGNIYPPLKMVEYGQRYMYMQAGTDSNSRPTSFYLNGDVIGFLPFPDVPYTARISYFPDVTPLTATDPMPYRNLFNHTIAEGMAMLARNRENSGMGMEPALMGIFQDRAMAIMRTRRRHRMFFHPQRSR